jgi:hypothetical protein
LGVLARTNGVLLIAGWVMTEVKVVLKNVVDVVSAEIGIDALRLPIGVAEELLGAAWNTDTELEVLPTEAETVQGRGTEEEPSNAAMEAGVLITTVSVMVEEPPLRMDVVVKVNATLAGVTET